VACRPRRLAPDRLAAGNAELDAMLQDGKARRAEGPWSSALHLMPKKDSGCRPFGDYRAFNSCTIPDRYTVPHIHDSSHRLSGCAIFSKIALVRAYHQIPVHPDDIQKTAITITFGLFEFPYMSFGLRKAAQNFQRFMDEVLKDLDFCFANLDDIFVFSLSPQEHHQHLRTLLTTLRSYGILMNAPFVLPKSPLWVTKFHPPDPTPSRNVLQIFNPTLLPKPSANLDIYWEC